MAGLYLAKLVEAVTGIPIDPEYDRLKKELDGASYEKTWEIVCQLLDGVTDVSPNGQGDAEDTTKAESSTAVIRSNEDIFRADKNG
jgi:hypothetical protein